MTRTAVSILLAAVLPALSACGRDTDCCAQEEADTTAVLPAAAANWRSTPADGVALVVGADSLVVATGPHTVLWEADGGELAPPYTVRATLQKRAGRLHEGVGLVFGGSGLEGSEAGQVYSYFLVRGDGSFLVKRRQGAETPVVRDWTTHPAIRRDLEEGQPNQLEVAVSPAEAVFRVNGAEVARVPAAELSIQGRAGVRVAHAVTLAVRGFSAAAAADSAGGAGQ